ncbi:MAG: hypothetical protein D6694_14565 [Gammaproteobacteria bacterium]|nr:MAG: hypothetical protein D6694_14565 [Gammaproteobacteria bacterium]
MSILILIEFVLPFAIFSALAIWFYLRDKNKQKQLLAKILDVSSKQEEKFKAQLQAYLADQIGLSEDALDDKLSELLKARRKVYQALVEALVSQDEAMAETLEQSFTELHSLYWQLTPAQETSTEAPADEAGEEAEAAATSLEKTVAENKVLKKENKRLKAEVHVSMSALNSLFAEFASMFGETTKSDHMMTVDEIFEAMQRFTKGDFKPKNIDPDLAPELAEGEPSSQENSPEADTEGTSEPLVEQDESTNVQEEDGRASNNEIESQEAEDEGTTPNDAITSEAIRDEVTEQTGDSSNMADSEDEGEPTWEDAFKEMSAEQSDGAADDENQASSTSGDDQFENDENKKE